MVRKVYTKPEMLLTERMETMSFSLAGEVGKRLDEASRG